MVNEIQKLPDTTPQAFYLFQMLYFEKSTGEGEQPLIIHTVRKAPVRMQHALSLLRFSPAGNSASRGATLPSTRHCHVDVDKDFQVFL